MEPLQPLGWESSFAPKPEQQLPNPDRPNPRQWFKHGKDFSQPIEVLYQEIAKKEEEASEHKGFVEFVHGAEVDVLSVEVDTQGAADGVDWHHEQDADDAGKSKVLLTRIFVRGL